MNKPETSIDLIERCRRGDRAAYGELFERFKNLVYRTAYLMLDDPNEADEILQEIFLTLFGSLESYRPEKGAFSTWLHRVTINRCLNHKRALSLLAQVREHLIWIARSASPGVENADEKETVRAALRRLSDPLRAVIVLRYYHDLSYTEIAEVLAISEGTVKSRINTAHHKLGGFLKLDFEKPLQLNEKSTKILPEVHDELPTGS